MFLDEIGRIAGLSHVTCVTELNRLAASRLPDIFEGCLVDHVSINKKIHPRQVCLNTAYGTNMVIYTDDGYTPFGMLAVS